MSARSHTTGPWRVGDAGNTVFGPPNGQVSPQTICEVRVIDHTANARLIAAAPDLLDALKKVMTHFVGARGAHNLIGEGGHVADAARAAIAKATE